jgi:hypothetical protein
MSLIAYVTDLEGRWDKLESFATDNPHVSLEGGALRLADGVTFVFGGDAIDRGPHGRRIVSLLLAARRKYGERVVLLAGNRDINKLRLWRELDGAPPASTPEDVRKGSRGTLLRWIFANTMGAKDAFAHRAAELESEGRRADDDAVVQSYLDDLAPNGVLRKYLCECQLGFRADATLFVHGGVTLENLGVVPGRDAALPDVDSWLDALGDLYSSEMNAFVAGRAPSTLIAYQAPCKGTRFNQGSVVYARLTDDLGNPRLPAPATIARLRESGIGRVVVGHTPSGDCPAFVRDDDFEVVLADNSYGRIERGSRLAMDDVKVYVDAITELDDGARALVEFTSERARRESPLGKRDSSSGQLVKAQLASGDFLLFRGLPGFRVEQVTASAEDLARRTLVAAHEA